MLRNSGSRKSRVPLLQFSANTSKPAEQGSTRWVGKPLLVSPGPAAPVVDDWPDDDQAMELLVMPSQVENPVWEAGVPTEEELLSMSALMGDGDFEEDEVEEVAVGKQQERLNQTATIFPHSCNFRRSDHLSPIISRSRRSVPTSPIISKRKRKPHFSQDNRSPVFRTRGSKFQIFFGRNFPGLPPAPAPSSGEGSSPQSVPAPAPPSPPAPDSC